MSDTTTETDWAEKIGNPTYENLAEMVAALECDYDRLEELREARDGWTMSEDSEDDPAADIERPDGTTPRGEAWAIANPDDAEELAELEAAAKPCGNECKDRDDAEEMIQQDPLSIEVRSDWVTLGSEMYPAEFCILLSTGGPATRIRGELGTHNEPSRAWLEVQDWFKPWTEYHASDSGDVLLTYARCFTYGQ